MNIPEHNRAAWNRQSREGSRWCTPVDSATIEKARRGDWEVILTPNKPVPRAWFGDLKGKDLLCLASGGGQQAPVFSAAGARVVSFDLSEEQLDKDKTVARRDGLSLSTVRGDMADLSAFNDNTFDVIFHPVSNVFVPDVRPVWRECRRVLRPNGSLLAGFINPIFYLFDADEAEKTGELRVRYRLPYSDADHLDAARKKELLDKKEAFEFSHMLDDQIGGQLAAGLVITGLYEDWWSDEATLLNRFAPTFLATRATKVPNLDTNRPMNTKNTIKEIP